MSDTPLSRRLFLQAGLGAAGALVLGVSLPSCSSTHQRAMRDLAKQTGRFSPNAWIAVTPDNRVLFTLDRVEMGQGTMTSHGMMVAEELDVPMSALDVVFARASRTFDHNVYQVQITGGSTSVVSSWEPLRESAATARAMLVQAAASQWGVEPTTCSTKQGHVVHASSGRKLPYGELTRAAATQDVPSDVTLKSPKDFRLLGKPVKRLDARAKSTGAAIYGIDVEVEGALQVAMIRPPTTGSQPVSMDASQARGMLGVRHVIQTPRGVAVVADKYWQALAASQTVTVTWGKGPLEGFSTDRLRETMATLTALPGDEVLARGSWEALAQRPELQLLEAEYETPFLAHATMEPQNCTAHFKGDSCEVWAPTQGPALAQDVVVALTGLAPSQVTIHQTLLGGGFGRRLAQDYVAEAVWVSRAIKAPVKIIWSREDDTQHDYYRPQTYAKMRGAIDANGQIVGYFHRLVGQSIMAQKDWVSSILPDWIPRVMRVMLSESSQRLLRQNTITDPTSVEGAGELSYGIPNVRVEYHQVVPEVPIGFWRSVGHSSNAFMIEGFFDELAHAAGQDPYKARRALLAKHPRHRGVLDAVAKHSDWGNAPEGIYQGIAQHHSFGSYCAHVVELSYPNGKDRPFKLERVVSAIDCGFVLNPDIVKAQIEGAVIFGLAAAIRQRITFERGHVQQGNFDTYPMLRMHEIPKIEVHLIDSKAPPTGAGEPGVPPIAPALTNAIFAATGKRHRRLPVAAPPIPESTP